MYPDRKTAEALLTEAEPLDKNKQAPAEEK